MTDQEIIDAIDGGIATMHVVQTNYTRGYREEAGAPSENSAYVDCLNFARALIVKRMNHRLYTRQGAYLDAGGAS